MRRFLFIITTLGIIGGACKKEFSNDNPPVAKVMDKYLLQSEIHSIIPPGASKQDSLLIAQGYIRKWITRELLLHKASQNLSAEERDISKQVEEYSSSILIHKYKEKLISQKLEFNISDADIERYYDGNIANFILNTTIVRAQLVILPKLVSNIETFRKWFLSNDAKDQEALEEYSITNAQKYDNFNDKWIDLRYLLNLLPITQQDWEKKYKYKSHVEVEDTDNYYFLKIHETLRELNIAPVGYVTQEIVSILQNRQKIEFEENLEREINKEGIQKNYVKLYR